MRSALGCIIIFPVQGYDTVGGVGGFAHKSAIPHPRPRSVCGEECPGWYFRLILTSPTVATLLVMLKPTSFRASLKTNAKVTFNFV